MKKAPVTAKVLKIPVRLVKLASKAGKDGEAVWAINLETHNAQAEYIQTLVPFIEHEFVMVLVKVDSVKDAKEKLDGEIEIEI